MLKLVHDEEFHHHLLNAYTKSKAINVFLRLVVRFLHQKYELHVKIQTSFEMLNLICHTMLFDS